MIDLAWLVHLRDLRPGQHRGHRRAQAHDVEHPERLQLHVDMNRAIIDPESELVL
jgi:hypothetical protein